MTAKLVEVADGTTSPFFSSGNIRPSILLLVHKFVQVCTAAWRNGIASDYESGDCRFDPCGGHLFAFFLNGVEELTFSPILLCA